MTEPATTGGEVSGADRARVGELDRYDVLHHPPRAELVAIVELAAKVCGTPMATINLISDVEQHQVATYGFEASVCSREDSMCAHVLDEDTPLVVADASLDPRFMDNPFVTGAIGNVRFYASHKLVTLSGVTIGTLCVFDEQVRDLDDSQVDALATLADRIVDVLELSTYSRQLARSNERLSAFASRVSHDLKSPLLSVSLALDLIRDQLTGGAEQATVLKLLDRAISGSERMARLIDDVLAFSAYGGTLEVRPVRLDAVLDDALADVGARLDGVELMREPLPELECDPGQLRSVFQNLLDNAAKYRHPDRPLRLQLRAREEDGRCEVRVADNGVGIPEAERRRVFDPRVRLVTDGDGMGIGLGTCRAIIQAHGGTIGIEETPGGGTTVWFRLPH